MRNSNRRHHGVNFTITAYWAVYYLSSVKYMIEIDGLLILTLYVSPLLHVTQERLHQFE